MDNILHCDWLEFQECPIQQIDRILIDQFQCLLNLSRVPVEVIQLAILSIN